MPRPLIAAMSAPADRKRIPCGTGRQPRMAAERRRPPRVQSYAARDPDESPALMFTAGRTETVPLGKAEAAEWGGGGRYQAARPTWSVGGGAAYRARRAQQSIASDFCGDATRMVDSTY